MLYRFDPVTCPRLYKIERDQIYRYHMHQKAHVKGGVDSTQPEMSTHHRLIAQRAAERRKTFLKKVAAQARASTSISIPYSTRARPDLAGGSTTAADLDPYASSQVLTHEPFVSPGTINFLLSGRETRSASRASISRADTAQASRLTAAADLEDDDILDISLSSDGGSDVASVFSLD
jgi:hypothetical protein